MREMWAARRASTRASRSLYSMGRGGQGNCEGRADERTLRQLCDFVCSNLTETLFCRLHARVEALGEFVARLSKVNAANARGEFIPAVHGCCCKESAAVTINSPTLLANFNSPSIMSAPENDPFYLRYSSTPNTIPSTNIVQILVRFFVPNTSPSHP